MKPITTSTTQKLFVLNELSKKIDLNLFNKFISFEEDERIHLYAKYNYDLYHFIKSIYGDPETYLSPTNRIDFTFTTETIQITLQVNTNN